MWYGDFVRTDGLAKWHPAFKDDVINRAKNNSKGAVRMDADSGEGWRKLLGFGKQQDAFRYRIIGDSPLDHTLRFHMSVGGKGGMTKVIWQGKFNNKADSGKTDDEVVELINGVYKSGLENLKQLLESRHT
jgi:hypothetical protein